MIVKTTNNGVAIMTRSGWSAYISCKTLERWNEIFSEMKRIGKLSSKSACAEFLICSGLAELKKKAKEITDISLLVLAESKTDYSLSGSGNISISVSSQLKEQVNEIISANPNLSRSRVINGLMILGIEVYEKSKGL